MTIDISKVSKEKTDRVVVKHVKNNITGNVLVLFKNGGLCIAYDEDAKTIAEQCCLCSYKSKDGEMLKFTIDLEHHVFVLMAKAGYKLCVIE